MGEFLMIKLKQILKEAIDPSVPQKAEVLRQSILQQYPSDIETLFFGIPNNQPNVLQLDNIRLHKSSRGKGIGSNILSQLKKFADEHELTMKLSPEPEPRYKAKLDKFYKGHGFVHNRGRKKDYRLASFYGPTMYRRPLKEEEIDEFELEDLQGTAAIIQYLESHDKQPEIINLGGSEYIIWDNNIVDPEYPDVKEKKDWIYSMEGQRLISNLVGAAEDAFNERFWNHPEILFHGTPKDNVESISKEGLKKRHVSRGLANRHISSAVFSTTEPEFAANSYGPALVTIRTDLMKKDNVMPYVTKEPNHTEGEVTDFIGQKIGAWEEGHHDFTNARSEGTTEDTVIIYSDIPPKYLKITE